MPSRPRDAAPKIPRRTVSGISVSGEPGDRAAETERPGEFPFTRGRNALGYGDEPWVMGMYSGRSTPKETNTRIRSLIASGQSGFSIALDLPTQLGLDSDHPMSEGEVGQVGVPIDSIEDMIALLDGVELDKVKQIRTTANSIGPIAVALFVAAAEAHGYAPSQFKVMLQNDSLKEYVARNTHIFPPRYGLKFSVDVIEYCAKELPHWEPIELCGYHIRDAGANAVQEVAIAVANGLEYIREAEARGLSYESFGHSLYMFLSAGIDFFEEVAKFRAARRVWAGIVARQFGLTDERAALNIFCYTLGSVQVATEPLNNIARIGFQAMAAVCGGVQTLATSSYDEAIGLPTAAAAQVGLRTQQILAYETGVARTVDPLAGSYVVEELTDQLERKILDYLDLIEARGGGLQALQSGFYNAEIDRTSYEHQRHIESGELPVVTVNCFTSDPDAQAADGAAHDVQPPIIEGEQVRQLQLMRERRDATVVAARLDELEAIARAHGNTIPVLIEAVKARATVGEICDTLASVWGRAE